MSLLQDRRNFRDTQNLELLRDMLAEYYGKKLQSRQDLSQKACCTDDTQKRYADILELIPAEVKARHYGCGCPIPDEDLTGLKVLDLGSGAGVDAFVLSYLVGPEGVVYGIDMTEEQLAIARNNAAIVMKRFGYPRTNVFFHRDFIEVAQSIEDESVDLVVSNCVINLSPLKDQVFKTIFRVLKEGGEFYISDIVADRRVPDSIRNDPQMIAECLGGAEYENDWLDLIQDCGFRDPRTVSRVEVQRDVAGEPVVFYSLTLRGFKFSDPLDRRCEDYGQIAIYKGSMPTQKARFQLDDHHVFEAHKPVPVCRNTARMLSETRLREHFQVTGPVKHFGLFPCGPAVTAASTPSAGKACC